MSFRAYSYQRVPDDVYAYISNLRIPLNPEGGIAYVVWKRKKPLYLPHIRKFEFEFDRTLIDTTRVASFLHVPLVVKDRSVAMISFSNAELPMRLSKRDINTIGLFCAQVAGVINTVHLLRQTAKQKADTAALNLLVKSLNENLDLQVIMQKVSEYVRETFGIQYWSLLVGNAEKTHLRVVAAALPEFVSTEDRARVFNFTEPLKRSTGAHGLTLRSKKPAYFAEFGEEQLHWLTEDERFMRRPAKLDRIFLSPSCSTKSPWEF